jgi:hypothetical protein
VHPACTERAQKTLSITFKKLLKHRNFDPEHWTALQELALLLEKYGVFSLLSPTYYPEYNASIEAGIGSFKTRAHHEAARHGHPAQWNCEDVEATRLQSNELSRPWGHDQYSPDIAWAERQTLIQDQRSNFAVAVQQLRQTKEQQLLPGIPLAPKDVASLRREVISRALIAQGFLCVRRRQSDAERHEYSSRKLDQLAAELLDHYQRLQRIIQQ